MGNIKRLTNKHPLTPKVKALEKYMRDNGLTLEWDGYRMRISDGYSWAIYRDVESSGDESSFPSIFESKLVIDTSLSE